MTNYNVDNEYCNTPIKGEAVKLANLTDTLVEIDKMQRDTIATLNLIYSHLFGQNGLNIPSSDADCFAEQLGKNLEMTNMILGCVKSIAEKIGVS